MGGKNGVRGGGVGVGVRKKKKGEDLPEPNRGGPHAPSRFLEKKVGARGRLKTRPQKGARKRNDTPGVIGRPCTAFPGPGEKCPKNQDQGDDGQNLEKWKQTDPLFPVWRSPDYWGLSKN